MLKIKSESHNDIEDNLPLKSFIQFENVFDDVFVKEENRPTGRSFAELNEYSMESCSLCLSIFHNKYDLIIHNTQHLIIPLTLVPFKTYQCTDCPEKFFTTQDLNTHTLNEHNSDIPEILGSILIDKDLLQKCEESVQEMINELNYDSDGDQKIVDEIFNDFHELKAESDNEIDIKDEFEIASMKIQHRLLFEDFNDDLMDNDEMPGAESPALPEPQQCEEVITVHSQFTNSVHYDDLKVLGQYKCRNCGVVFGCRLDLVKHEMVHIKITTRHTCPLCVLCEKLIVTRLGSHYHRNHPEECPNKEKTKKCKICHLRYFDYRRHLRNYHKNDKIDVVQKIETAKKVNEKDVVEKDVFEKGVVENDLFEHTILCYMCLTNLEWRPNVQIVTGDKIINNDKTNSCKRCCRKTEVLITVKYRFQRKPHPKKKPLTNEERLRNIKKRLKITVSKFKHVQRPARKPLSKPFVYFRMGK